MRSLVWIPLTLLLVAAPWAQAEESEAKQRKQAAKVIAAKLASKNDEEVFTGLHEAALNQDSALTAPITRLLKSKNPAVRYGAIETLATRSVESEQKKAARSLAARLKPLADKEDNREELLKVISALHDLAQPSTIKALLDSKNEEDREVRQARAMAVANVPTKEAIERLIQYGYKDRKGAGRTRDIATKALAYATGARVKGSIEGWRKWWSDNKKDYDPFVAADARAEKRAANAAREARKAERKNKKKGKKKKANA